MHYIILDAHVKIRDVTFLNIYTSFEFIFWTLCWVEQWALTWSENVANKHDLDGYHGNETTMSTLKIDGFQLQKILGMYLSVSTLLESWIQLSSPSLHKIFFVMKYFIDWLERISIFSIGLNLLKTSTVFVHNIEIYWQFWPLYWKILEKKLKFVPENSFMNYSKSKQQKFIIKFYFCAQAD